MAETGQPDPSDSPAAQLVLPPLVLGRPEPGAAGGERRDAAANRRQILTCARELFAARGVDAVTMEELAAAAGVGKGTLYRRFPHKGALCLELLGENALRFAAEFERLAAAEEGTTLDLIAQFLALHVAFNEENGALLSAAGDAALGARRGWLYTTPIYQWLRATLQALLAYATARGEIRPLNLAIAPDILLAPFAIDLYQHQRHALGLSSAELLAAAHDLVMNGLR